MINSKKLIEIVRKWQRLAAIGRKRISFTRTRERFGDCNPSIIVDKGHFVVYTADQQRFVIPLAYLSNAIFRELLKMAEEEHGLPSDGPITLPCDAVFIEYAVSLIRRNVAKDMEKALLMSITTAQCLSSSCLQQEQSNQKLLICSF